VYEGNLASTMEVGAPAMSESSSSAPDMTAAKILGIAGS